jgi:Carboxypeptidase regulatory-like domain
MKNFRYIALLSLIVSLSLAGAASADTMSAMQVTVTNSAGKTLQQVNTDSSGAFRTPSLAPGHYTVKFNAKSAPKGGPFALVVGEGKNAAVANGVPGAKFTKGGVAMKVEVGPKAMALTGHVSHAGAAVANGAAASATHKDGVTTENGLKVKYEKGQKYVWVEGISAMGGHWALAGSRDAANAEKTGRQAPGGSDEHDQ